MSLTTLDGSKHRKGDELPCNVLWTWWQHHKHCYGYYYYYYCLISEIVPSVLWRCWLGGRKGIQPVKNLSGGGLAWLSVWSKMQTCILPSWCHCHSLSLASVKSRLVLPFWYRLTRVVSEKGPLNVCCHRLISETPSTSSSQMWVWVKLSSGTSWPG